MSESTRLFAANLTLFMLAGLLALPACSSEDPPPRLIDLPADLSLAYGDTQTFALTLKNPASSTLHLNLRSDDPDLGVDPASLKIAAETAAPIGLSLSCTAAEGPHQARLFVDDHQTTQSYGIDVAWTCEPNRLDAITIGPHQPISDLSTALRATSDGATIDLKPGLYLLSEPLPVERSLRLRAVDDKPTVITTFNRHHAFQVHPRSALFLEGLELRAASGPTTAAISSQGDLWLLGTTIADGHSQGLASALSSDHGLLAHDLTLRDNRAALGSTVNITGGHGEIHKLRATHNHSFYPTVSNHAHLSIANAIISHNTAQQGAGIYNRGHISLRASTLEANHADQLDSFGAGIYQVDGHADLAHTIFSQNRATFGAALTIDAGTVDADHISVFDNEVDAGNPVLVDSPATFITANSVLAGTDNTYLSVDLIDGADLITHGGNLVTHPGFAWPNTNTTVPDLLPSSPSRPLEWASHAEADAPPSSDRHHIPGDQCRDPQGTPIAHQSDPSPHRAIFCEPGAHLSQRTP